MPSFQQIITDTRTILENIFGNNIPPWIINTFNWFLLVSLVLVALWGLLSLVNKIKELWTQNFWPLFYNHDEKQRSTYRKYFAEHIENEIIRIGRQEDWKDHRFAELEAEVEIEGKQKTWSWIPFVHKSTIELQREHSLSKALAKSRERLILVEGEPGSGKSVALRYITRKLSQKAKIYKNNKSVIPLYINLKDLHRHNNVLIDRNLIETFILSTLRRIKDRDIDAFLENEFHKGLEEGTWLFLFDSFDEIPEILSSTESDNLVKLYGNAIDDFLHGMNRCRGIVASRQFHGPAYLKWPHFTVLALTLNRQHQLIQKYNLKRDVENRFIGQLALSNEEIQIMARNPLFLSLLCEHIKNGYPFPKDAHSIFETYISNRIKHDKDRIIHKFQVEETEIKTATENIAYCMTIDRSLGLSAPHASLKKSYSRYFPKSQIDLDPILDALVYMKLAREDISLHLSEDQNFTFAHRRFQEYFTTCFVIHNPERVSPKLLLTDAQWRETTVTLCQTQPLNQLQSLVKHMTKSLKISCINITKLQNELNEQSLKKQVSQQVNIDFICESFPIFTQSLHILKIIQEGFFNRFEELPKNTRKYVGEIVLATTKLAAQPDRKLALEVSGASPEPVKTYIVTEAFKSQSVSLRSSAYQQISQLQVISSSIEQGIKEALLNLWGARLLQKNKHQTRAHLMRLSQPQKFLSMINALLFLDKMHHITSFISLLTVATIIFDQALFNIFQIFIMVSLLFIIYVFHTYILTFYSLFMNLYSRFLLLFYLVVTLGLASFIDNYVVYCLCLLSIYLSTIFPSYLLLSNNLFNLKLFNIGYLPIYLFYKDIINLVNFIHNIHKKVKIYKFIAIFLVTALIVVFAAPAVTWVMSPHNIIGNVVVTGVIFILGFPIALYKGFNHIRASLEDRIRWNKWFANGEVSIDCHNIGEATNFHSSLRVIESLKNIRINKKFKATGNMELLIRKIALKLEQNQKNLSNKSEKYYVLITDNDETDKNKIEGYLTCSHLYLNNNPILLDEIYSLLENIQSTRQKQNTISK